MPQRDLMLGWIEQVSRLVEELLHGPGTPDLQQASDRIDAAVAQHLGNLASLLPQLDVGSAANLLSEPERIFGYAQLLMARADVADAGGTAEGPPIKERALAFARLALARADDPPASWRAWIAEREAAPHRL